MKIQSIPRMVSVAALALFLLAGVQMACAAPQSEVNVEFQEGNEVVTPVDPDDPSKPLNPEEPGTGESGALTLNYISPVTFGQRTISAAEQTYFAKTLKPFVQVTDLRGTGAGWRVTAQAHPFMASGEASLNGAAITFKSGEAVSATTGLAAPVPEADVVLPTSGSVVKEIVSAGTGAGLGTWVTRWYPSAGSPVGENNSVTLKVLAGTATLDTHIAKITWTLVSD